MCGGRVGWWRPAHRGQPQLVGWPTTFWPGGFSRRRWIGHDTRDECCLWKLIRLVATGRRVSRPMGWVRPHRRAVELHPTSQRSAAISQPEWLVTPRGESGPRQGPLHGGWWSVLTAIELCFEARNSATEFQRVEGPVGTGQWAVIDGVSMGTSLFSEIERVVGCGPVDLLVDRESRNVHRQVGEDPAAASGGPSGGRRKWPTD